MDAVANTFWTTPGGWTLITVAQIMAVILPLLVALAFFMLADRKIWAGVQMRKGPNVVGPFGLLQSFADLIKFVLKEIVIPDGADKFVFLLAPVLTFVLAMVGWAVIPFAPGWVVSDINVGVLYLFAISSLGVYGIIMGGWASNSKYPFLGSLRSAAQMVSYEVSLGLIIINVILLAAYLALIGIRIDGKDRLNIQAGAAVLVLMLAGYFAIHLVAPYELNYHLMTSLNRLYMQLWPSAVFLFFMAARTPEQALDGGAATPAKERIAGDKHRKKRRRP